MLSSAKVNLAPSWDSVIAPSSATPCTRTRTVCSIHWPVLSLLPRLVLSPSTSTVCPLTFRSKFSLLFLGGCTANGNFWSKLSIVIDHLPLPCNVTVRAGLLVELVISSLPYFSTDPSGKSSILILKVSDLSRLDGRIAKTMKLSSRPCAGLISSESKSSATGTIRIPLSQASPEVFESVMPLSSWS